MAEVIDPYKTLRVPRDADLTAIEDAYDSLFDEYEPEAQVGNQNALQMLDRLNEARDVLVDPERRAALDRELSVLVNEKSSLQSAETTPARARASRTQPGTRSARGASTSQRAQTSTETVRMRRRGYEQPRYVSAKKAFSPLPYILVGVLLLALGGAAFLLLNKVGPQCPPPAEVPRGQIVATVNGEPLYAREFEEQANFDKKRAESDPMVMGLIGSFDTITGTRFLDGLSYDSLDKRINMEIIQQEAKKEGLYPTDAQIPGLVNDAKAAEVKPGESFECFLSRVGVSEAQYKSRVIENVVYVAMANKHLPTEGSAEKRTGGFINWICETRKRYDVQPKLTFIVKENQPCTSGLPSDRIPLPGIDETPSPNVPEPIATPVAPLTSTTTLKGTLTAPTGPTKSASQTPQATERPRTAEPTPQPTKAGTISVP